MKKNHRKPVILGCCLLFLTLPPAAWAIDGQIKIGQPASGESYPLVINHAGSYVLTDNLVVNDPVADAIRIEHNDVTLDLNGHTIRGPATFGTGNGIWAQDRYSITILNGRVWGFGNFGIFLYTSGDPGEKSAGHIIMNIQTLNNKTSGILISGGKVANCIANSNSDTGIVARYSSLNNCTANKNGTNGIDVTNSSVTNCTASFNTDSGIFTEGGARVENNLTSDNGYCGLNVDSNDNYVIKNSGKGNGVGVSPNPPGSNYIPLSGDNANIYF